MQIFSKLFLSKFDNFWGEWASQNKFGKFQLFYFNFEFQIPNTGAGFPYKVYVKIHRTKKIDFIF